MQEYSTIKNIFIVNIFYDLDCVEQINKIIIFDIIISKIFVLLQSTEMNLYNIENKLNLMMSVYLK